MLVGHVNDLNNCVFDLNVARERRRPARRTGGEGGLEDLDCAGLVGREKIDWPLSLSLSLSLSPRMKRGGPGRGKGAGI